MSKQAEFKVTYATMTADNEALHAAFDAAIKGVKQRLGQTHPVLIGGQPHTGEATFADINPADTRMVVGHFQKATPTDVKKAIAAAQVAFPAWRKTPYRERISRLRRAADLISERRFELSAMMIMEMGKNRLEALGDVEESADLIRYYCHQMETHQGYRQSMNPLSAEEHNQDVLKPYGVWAVISPFNFPLALAAGPVGAALVTGNTVVLKPSSDAPWTGLELIRILHQAGVPTKAANLVTGPGSTVGTGLVDNEGVDGITFTGSYEIGFKQIYQRFSKRYPKPVVVEMGGKNPTIVTAHADLEKATNGVMRAAFGLGGQKCSACSRVYVQKEVFEPFIKRLIDKTRAIVIGNPLHRDVFLGPLVNENAYRTFQSVVEQARKDGQILYGGATLSDGEYAHGWYVEPTIVSGLPQHHELVQQELFVPFLVILPVASLDEALEKANDVIYGLTAGIFSEDEQEIETFFDRIQAGVTYANRAASATTGAWPGCQPFGGWRASGSSGRAIGGHYTLFNYLHEQSQTIIRS